MKAESGLPAIALASAGAGSDSPASHARCIALVSIVMSLASLHRALAAPFSDTNWISLGGLAGTDNTVFSAVVDGSGNLYIGGDFTNVGAIAANHVAKWNGANW